jgi:CMP-N,N'-diacetyllegionaminic acid synthase
MGCHYNFGMNIAFIPAKGTSNRVPRKNLQLLGGKSLVRITLEFAEDQRLFDYVYLSTDSVEIVRSATGSKQFDQAFLNSEQGVVFHTRNNLYVHKRRDGHSSQSAKTIVPLLDCLNSVGHNSGIATILQPTSPFRFIAEYQDILKNFQESKAASMISVREVMSPHPLKCFQITEDGDITVTDELFDHLTTPQQELPKYFAADGAYYLSKIDLLIAHEQILAQQPMTHLRQGVRTLNIDTAEELEFAQRFVETNPSILSYERD